MEMHAPSSEWINTRHPPLSDSPGSLCYHQGLHTPGVCRLPSACRAGLRDNGLRRAGRQAQKQQQQQQQMCSTADGEPLPLVCCPTSSESILFPNTGFLSLSKRPSTPPPPYEPRPPPPADGTPGSMANRMCVAYEQYAARTRYGPENDCVPNHTYPIGGNPALSKEFPHMALLGYGPRSSISYECGGSLISLAWVMTAAHCVFSGSVPVSWVLLGELVRSRDDDDAFPQLIPVAQRVSHPGFRPPEVYNDIALLRLQRVPNMTTFHVRPACLHVDRELAREKLYLTGWGHTEYQGEPADALMEVSIYRTKYEECAKAYEGALSKMAMPRGVDDDTMLCAGQGQLRKDACQGDSGGPLQTPVIKPMCMFRVAGIVSLGQGCGFGTPGIYTRVSHYVPWIESIVWPDPAA
ncbi:Serine protease snake [Frankliniella fusca]|uniref:Serine protease snake n=1 Tax=Frankliniella fusca TaxID=407009 RepID=A0AAE1HUB2_9NEOP|nr:Serine protease snake [Frankliniella fusca]